MKITIEKGKKVLSLTEKEFDELRWMVQQFDGGNIGVDSSFADAIKVGRKWCKAVGIPSYGYVDSTYW